MDGKNSQEKSFPGGTVATHEESQFSYGMAGKSKQGKVSVSGWNCYLLKIRLKTIP